MKPNESAGDHTAVTIENNESLWAIDFTDFKVDGTSIASNGGKAVIDSGSYAIQLESSAYDKFKDYMNELTRFPTKERFSCRLHWKIALATKKSAFLND